MDKKDNAVKTALQCLIPAFCTLIVFLGVLFIKKIFPFGADLIDYYDMGQTNAPLYYHIWDFLHGRSPLFFDWYINGGQNLAMGSAIQWNISPFNLYFLLIPRELTYVSLSLYMGLHLFFMSFNMGLFIKSIFPRTDKGLFFIAAMSYGLCGYTLTHYTIPTYLDTAVFFPIFAISVMRLLRGSGRLMYVLMLGFMTALSYYLGFMDLIYVLLFSGVYITLILERQEDRKRAILDISIGTAGGLLLSAFMLLPSAMEMLLSSRFNSNVSGNLMSGILSILNSIGADQYYVKYFQLYAMELFIMLIAIGAFSLKDRPKRVLAALLSAFIPCALIVFEAINILWHFGTYYHYPIRCGYLIPFSLIAAAVSLNANPPKSETGSAKVYIKYCATSAIISIIALFILIRIYDMRAPWDIKLLFRSWTVLCSAVFVILLLPCLLLRFVKGCGMDGIKPMLTAIAIPLTVTELILGAYIGYGMPKFTDSFFGDPEQSGQYILKAEALKSEVPGLFQEDGGSYRIERIKNPDTDLNTNYGMVVRRATVTGWANTATREQIEGAEKLGYSTHFMRILDSGGTFLTDAVLQVKDIVSERKYGDDIEAVYSKKGEYHTEKIDFYVYGNKAAFPFAMPVNRSIADLDFGSIAENNNILYRALSGKNEDIASVIKLSEINNNSNLIDKGFKLGIEGKKALYLSRGKADEIRVNGKVVPVPTIKNRYNTSYPAWFNSNLLYIGIFEDEDVEINCSEKSRIITLDIDKLMALSEGLTSYVESAGYTAPDVGKAGISFDINGNDERGSVLIPLAYSPGWSAYVNGQRADITDINGLLMLIPLGEGENHIEMKFFPPGLRLGIVISLLTLAACFALVYIKLLKAYAQRIAGFLSPAVYYIYYFIFFAAALILYIIPIAWFIVHVILKRLL